MSLADWTTCQCSAAGFFFGGVWVPIIYRKLSKASTNRLQNHNKTMLFNRNIKLLVTPSRNRNWYYFMPSFRYSPSHLQAAWRCKQYHSRKLKNPAEHGGARSLSEIYSTSDKERESHRRELLTLSTQGRQRQTADSLPFRRPYTSTETFNYTLHITNHT